jgi:uncharacterized C2H2 Zn-finger protein
MEKNNAVKMHSCSFCNYTTKRKFDLKRHQNAKHITNEGNSLNVYPNLQNVFQDNANVIQDNVNVPQYKENVFSNNENIINNIENDNINKFICIKCNKLYKTKKYLENHEKTCNGVDILTCPRCMISFANRKSKSKHIIRNTCKPRSIIHARTPNVQNIITNNSNSNNTTYNNINTNSNNNNNNITNNNFIINNYGNERVDYIDKYKFLEIFKKCYDIPSALTKEIHFNTDFPENKNIKDYNKTTALIKTDETFIMKDKKLLVDEIITNKTRMINNFAILNKEFICQKMDNEQYYEIIEIIFNFLIKEPKEHYKKQVIKIIDMIKNNT